MLGNQHGFILVIFKVFDFNDGRYLKDFDRYIKVQESKALD